MRLASRPVDRLTPIQGTDRPTLARLLRRQLQLNGVATEERPYPQPLPPELAPWHVYHRERGHSLMVQIPSVEPAQIVMPSGDRAFRTSDFVFAPVKSVLRASWRLHNGHLQSPLRYEPEFGLLTDPGDDEF